MKNNDKIKTILLAAFFIAFAYGCAAGPPEARHMVPSADYSGFNFSGKTLKVAEVKGGEKTKPMNVPTIDNEGFQEASVNTLKKSGMFKEVSTNREGDYELMAEIVSQKWQPGLPGNVTLFIHYRLIDTESNQVFWKETIFSQYSASMDDAPFGLERAKMSTEGAVRDNLTKLLRKLSDVLYQR
jgi:hypothetical protein